MSKRPLSSASSSARGSGEKKRKQLPSPKASSEAERSNQATTRLQLDDILSSLTVPVKTDRVDASGEGRSMKRLRTDVDGGKGKGKGRGTKVNALDLLLGGSDVSRADAASRKSKDASQSTASSSEVKDERIIDLQPEKGNPKAQQPSTASASKPTLSSSRPSSTSTTADPSSSSSHQPSQPNPSSPSYVTSAPIDAAQTHKRIKHHLRSLLSTLETLQTESILLDRMWYKNRAQFRSASWWIGFDGVRRTLHRLFPSSSSSSSEGIVGKQELTMTRLIRIYAGLAGTTSVGATLPKVPRPTPASFHAFLHSSTALEQLHAAKSHLEALQVLLGSLKRRTRKAGTSLVVHLNTPPAPTFAVVTTSLVALLAGIHAELESVCGKMGGEEGEGEIGLLLGVVDDLVRAARS